MTQKDKVKELVGRGLHSYHTKALQQMDRIEKKNKEQNHKISILTNELDNDYLTKTEEGSVVSLEHSKEGMVYLDKLQGNTLVNYCTDGSKEMTLNGDIDLEGISVTTTEGVDNGKVDVMCEGNTLVNLADIQNEFHHTNVTNWYKDGTLCETSKLKLNTPYTFIIDKEYLSNHNTNYQQFQLGISNSLNTTTDHPIFEVIKGNINFNNNNKEIKKFVANFTDFKNSTYLSVRPCRRNTSPVEGESANYRIKVIVLEGDFMSRETPPYFIGMKSVGQDDANGHKIEILSNNGSYFNAEDIKSYAQNLLVRVLRTKFDNVKEYFNYVNAFNSNMELGDYYYVNDDGGSAWIQIPPELKYNNNEVAKWLNSKICNKKEILLNEPLRGLPNGVKDRFVKIGGKSYIERNCGEFTLTEFLEGITHNVGVGNQTSTMVFAIDRIINDLNYKQLVKNGVCDRFSNNTVVDVDKELIYFGQNINIRIDKTKLTSQDTEGFKQWLRNNPTKIVYQLETPIYEPLEIEPTLNTYNDITHISNNSIIPCNMKIQNTGYNAIIKPSTLYTITLDTDKSGTIGMNLGGAKGTTTNNVSTLTTPATLADDSLRLYGKGIKGSKVRLLEGDKTNWIPSHFEGMKSSFEDKFDVTDNTYKMEILSYTKKLQNQLLNPNLKSHPFQRTTIDGDWNVFQWNIGDYYISTKDVINGDKFKNGDKVYVKFDVIKLSDAHYTDTIWCGRIGGYNTTIFSGEFYNSLPINQQKTLKTIITHNPPDSDPRTFKIDFGGFRRDIECEFKIKDITVVNLTRLYGKGNEPTIEWCDENIPYYNTNDMHYVDMNKIQFSSMEPLRGIGDVKDRFVFKDDKLMIERNCKELRLTTENLKLQGQHGANTRFYYDVRLLGFDMGQKPLCVENLKQVDFYDKSYTSNSSYLPCYGYDIDWGGWQVGIYMPNNEIKTLEDAKIWLDNNVVTSVWKLSEPTYEEVPFELQKIILEGYENGTLFFDTNIPPTSTVTYAGETPIVSAIKTNKSNVISNTQDINDNIIPYLMDMDYRVVCLQLATEEIEGGVSMARLFGGTYEMLKRDIQSNRLTKEEYGYRLTDYFNAGKLTEEEVRELEDLI